MGREDVLEEVDRRIKRLQAEVELAEERLRYLDRIGAPSKYRALRREDYSIYYLLLMAVWVLLGFLALMAISHRLPYGFNFPLLPYLLVVLVVIVLPLAYYYLSRREEPKTPMDELEERERLARLVLSLFYVPLREAIEKDDRKAMESLAEELLNNPLLAEAVEKTKEGDPKVMAYALYLYATYRPEMEGEVRETLSILSNKPLRALLSTIIKG
ncbi:hypothetical protein [Thermococcus thermotolerans]|uniref:hypothetical protein n=1 Tax=Thermococcus thermotolerans TaxID=2969672 RepID=UPI002158888C|nr:hypothetical protein [Thermococcus thermotolerans]